MPDRQLVSHSGREQGGGWKGKGRAGVHFGGDDALDVDEFCVDVLQAALPYPHVERLPAHGRAVPRDVVALGGRWLCDARRALEVRLADIQSSNSGWMQYSFMKLFENINLARRSIRPGREDVQRRWR